MYWKASICSWVCELLPTRLDFLFFSLTAFGLFVLSSERPVQHRLQLELLFLGQSHTEGANETRHCSWNRLSCISVGQNFAPSPVWRSSPRTYDALVAVIACCSVSFWVWMPEKLLIGSFGGVYLLLQGLLPVGQVLEVRDLPLQLSHQVTDRW